MGDSKRVMYSASLVIYNQDRTKYLITRRPLNDDSMPGYWGFPTASKKYPDELWEDVVHRAAKIKLGVEIEIVKMLGEDEIDRGEYILKLRDYEAKVISGEISVPQKNQEGTQYVDFRWTSSPSELIKAAKGGSLCARIFLKYNETEDDATTIFMTIVGLENKISVSALKEMAEKMFGNLVKAVVDLEKGIMAVDGELHSDMELLLIENGSKRVNLWGINLYPEFFGGEQFIEFDSMINIKPAEGNRSRGVESPEIRKKILEIAQKLVLKD